MTPLRRQNGGTVTPMGDVRLTLRIPAELHERLQHAAQRSARSINNYATRSLTEYLDHYDRQHAKANDA